MDTHSEALTIGLDIAQAFDVIWHFVLISKLPGIGLSNNLCQWICSFLYECKIRILDDENNAHFISVNAGDYINQINFSAYQ